MRLVYSLLLFVLTLHLTAQKTTTTDQKSDLTPAEITAVITKNSVTLLT